MKSLPSTRSRLALLLALLLTFSATLTSSAAALIHYDDGRVYLPGLPFLTFAREAVTIGRRSRTVPQLQCVGGGAAAAAGEDWPLHVDCFNDGFYEGDSGDGSVRWECVGMPRGQGFELREEKVHCEGFAFTGDLWVVKGSCSLEYKLEFADVERGNEGEDGDGQSSGRSTGGMPFVVFCGVLVVIAGYLCTRGRKDSGSEMEREQLITHG